MIAIFNTGAGFFVDLFLLILILLLPVMVVAVNLVRRGKVKAHARIMQVCFVLFLLAVLAFEAQVHFGEPGPPLARTPLVIHLIFAIPTLGVWIWQMVTAKHALTRPRQHRTRGKALMLLLAATVATGAGLYVETWVRG